MSYDLLLKPKNGNLTVEQFKIYFATKPHFGLSLDGENLQARYENKTTGVSFYFQYQHQSQDEEVEYYPITFNIGFFKPTYFANEADVELKALVDTYNLMVDDPQMNGMGVGDYQSDKFISTWLHANDLVCKPAILSNKEIPTLPSEKIESVWLWNKQKNTLQENVTDDVFVPTIMYFRKGGEGEVLTACVWEDGIPIVMPPVDIVIIVRKDLAPKEKSQKVNDIAVVIWDEIEHILNNSKLMMQGNAYYLFYKRLPFPIRKFIINLPKVDIKFYQRIPAEYVLEQ